MSLLLAEELASHVTLAWIVEHLCVRDAGVGPINWHEMHVGGLGLLRFFDRRLDSLVELDRSPLVVRLVGVDARRA